MAHIVFGWELGGGYGHLGPFRPVAERLMASGHRITLIVKDLARAGAAFGDLDIQLYQAPVKISKAIPHNPAPATFGHLLQNMGFGDPQELKAMVQAWRNLYQLIRPDCLVLDHAPTGILASRGLSIPSFTIGTGFFCPVDEFPLCEMAPWRPMPKELRARDEQQFIERINGVLQSNRQPTIDRIGQIYSDVTANLLTTFKELDHYPHRQGGGVPRGLVGQEAAPRERLGRDTMAGWRRSEGLCLSETVSGDQGTAAVARGPGMLDACCRRRFECRGTWQIAPTQCPPGGSAYRFGHSGRVVRSGDHERKSRNLLRVPPGRATGISYSPYVRTGRIQPPNA
ncbi:hypothetical protein C5Y96_01945 [Blastopirellula marina]|uniref:Glycosyltransferase subfamily 4-like N-terminal domain-containing protein n=1 Tax=Blastopirellula marina TaxID=124 RepID=A0A2S8G790_9BACT|nr:MULTISPECIES: hypothetical protein [Pirellulaceae]PQO40121.1 hypothetical protein C5Y96_01945 [Blastopirellula marina]RCS55792.1 hypothetical protein DTL36_01950 [Bremerella cremea]